MHPQDSISGPTGPTAPSPAASASAADVAALQSTIASQEETIAKLRAAVEHYEGIDEALAEARQRLEKLAAPQQPNDDPVTRDFEASTTKHTSAALAHAASNEPIFVLRGQDPLSGPLVRLWIAAAKLVGVDEAKVGQALTVADELDAWPRKKLPD